MSFFGFNLQQQQPEWFSQPFRVYPVSFAPGKEHLEKGDKIILPASALDKLARLNISYPMLFELKNPQLARTMHCGVMEFSADEGVAYVPYWMMQNLLAQEGDVIQVTSASIKKGRYVKFRPQTKDFLDISNPKAVLESSLRGYSALQKGTWIQIQYNSKNYQVDIIDTKPDNAVSIIETDMDVDFAAPADYVEPTPAPKSAAGGGAGTSADQAAMDTEVEVVNPVEGQSPKKFEFTSYAGTGYTIKGATVASTEAAAPPPEPEGRPRVRKFKFPRPSESRTRKVADSGSSSGGPPTSFQGKGQALKP